MPTILGKSVSQTTIDRIVAAFNENAESGQELTATQIQSRVRQQIVNRVKKFEDRVASAALSSSDFELV